jgi:flagellin
MALMDDITAGSPNTVTIQLGPSASQTMSLVFEDWSTDDDGVYGGTAGDLSSATIDDDTSAAQAITDASAAITVLDTAITSATAEQAKYGAYLSRLQHAADNINNVSTNLDQSRSRIEDADYAVETTNLARTQIIAQASTAMLAQANQVKQTVLALLQ